MTIPGEVHWHEGLFLQPHHLQTMQHQLIDRINAERRLTWVYPYGLIEARLSADALENMLVRFDRLRVVMPSGLEINYPDTTDLPSLDISQPFAASSSPFLVSLAVPLWYSGRANTIDPATAGAGDHRVKRLFKTSDIQRTDENTGENPQPLTLRRLNARLILPDEDHTDLETVPLLRIAHSTGENVGLPKQDPAYIPPCLVINGSQVLREMLRDLANQVLASRSELTQQLSRGGFAVDTMRGVQFEQMLRLRSLNRFGARLKYLCSVPNVSPFMIYLELRELLGELAALHPDRDQFEAPDYHHDNFAGCFPETISKIRSLLRGAVQARFISVNFANEGRLFSAALTEENFTQPTDYFLGIKTKEDPTWLAKLVEDGDKFKMMSKSKIALRIFGVKLTHERVPPLELPAQAGLHYFRLVRGESQRMWEAIKEEKSLAVRWTDNEKPMETSDFALTLYMTLPG